MDSTDIQPFSTVINNTFNSISLVGSHTAQVVDTWAKVLLGIRSKNPSEGANLASHSRVVDLKNGVLLVEADHPGWITLLQFHKKFILTGMKRAAPSLRIDTLAFRLAGKRGNLTGEAYSEKDVRKGIAERIEKEESALNSLHKDDALTHPQEKTKPMPAELAALFDTLRQDMGL